MLKNKFLIFILMSKNHYIYYEIYALAHSLNFYIHELLILSWKGIGFVRYRWFQLNKSHLKKVSIQPKGTQFYPTRKIIFLEFSLQFCYFTKKSLVYWWSKQGLGNIHLIQSVKSITSGFRTLADTIVISVILRFSPYSNSILLEIWQKFFCQPKRDKKFFLNFLCKKLSYS